MTGFFHFYNRKAELIALRETVSMPYDGLFSFLQAARRHIQRGRVMCQCPMTGFFHFYKHDEERYSEFIQKVSMPYDGLFSFLPSINQAMVTGPTMCQCPMTGFFHFYPYFKFALRELRDVCQCPMTGFFHFYPHLENCLILCGFPASFSEVFF